MDVEQPYQKQKYRGKLYALSDESAWEDTGTGYVSIVGNDDKMRLIFRDEETGDVLHDRPVFGRDTYQLQGEGERRTIIVWEDPESQKDWALSFQDPEGTTEVWEAIRKEGGLSAEKRLLPLPTFANLAELGRMLTCVPPSQREALAAECISAKFIAGLQEAFHTAEDLNSEEALVALFQVTKGVFFLSNQRLTERYLKHDIFDDVMGMLEYDDGLPADKRISHRQVLKVQVRYQQVLTFEDAETLERIHLNYRLQYLKDIVLPRLLDDAALVSLTQMIHSNLAIILDHLMKNAQLMAQLFEQIRQRDLQSLMFLQDVCRLAKQIVPGERQALYEKMIELKLYEVLTPFLSDLGLRPKNESASSHPARHLAVEVLLLSAQTDPSQLRRFLTSTNAGAEEPGPGRLLLNALIRLMHVEQDQGVQSQIAELLRAVMDPTPLEQRERDSYLEAFYERNDAMNELVAPLRELNDSAGSARPSEYAQQLVCELLAFAVTNHGYVARVYVMRHGVAQLVVRLMTTPHRFLQLAPLRFMRAMIQTKDDAYHKYIVKSGLLSPLMKNLQQSLQPPALGGNLVVGATLELLEFIRFNNIKVLIECICKKHAEFIQEFAPKFKTLEGILLKHQQNLEYEAFPPDQHASGGPIARGNAGGRGGRTRSPGRGDSDDDEAYFESLDDDDEDQSTAQPAANGKEADAASGTGLRGLLGNYEDEEEAQPAQQEAGDAPASKEPADEALKADDKVAAGEAEAAETNGLERRGSHESAAAAQQEAAAAGQSSVDGLADGPADAPAGAGVEATAKVESEPLVSEGVEGEESGETAGVLSEKSLNHVPKRLKRSAAA
eukprot:TRINITY_DN10651_c0_g1_i1.p1 TRINITY_DN10651_c0_g1~~TRINITY_DN10651_c0_g1_i1.p1  ORF type:complete len:838 (+),score=156.64 TRINITY_DN10651_c0_g1_i1:187-2700(+)